MIKFKDLLLGNEVTDKILMEYFFDEELDNPTFRKKIVIIDSPLTERKQMHTNPFQNWGNIDGNSKEEKLKNAEKLYKNALDVAKKAEQAFARTMKKNTKMSDSKVLVDIKSADSFVDKIVNRGKNAKKIHDLLRGAIICKTKEDVEYTVEKLKRNAVIHELEYKEYGQDKEYGYYGSYHFKIFIEGIIAEIQVMTRKLWSYKFEAHNIYDKYRSLDKESKEFDQELKKLDLQLSRELFQRGNS
jgi:ppGpp synthetase/RelA/SpoT-type nucleotidyltranferase